MTEDAIWQALELSLLFHVRTHSFCSCDICRIIEADLTFTTVASDFESARLRELFNKVSVINQAVDKESITMSTKSQQTDDATFNIRSLKGCSQRDHFLTGKPDEALNIVAGYAISVLPRAAAVEPRRKAAIAHEVWSLVRSVELRPGFNIEQALGQNPIQSIMLIVSALIEAGDLTRTLTQQREDIDRTLRFLESRFETAR